MWIEAMGADTLRNRAVRLRAWRYVLIGLILLTGQVTLVRAEANPYGITTEDQLRTVFRERIEPFWGTGQSGTFKGVGDVTIAYVAFAKGTEEIAIVLSSGRTESYVKYKELIYDLSRQGFAVYILDHRGQGFSGRVNADPSRRQMGDVISFNDYVADLHTFYHTVVAPTGADRQALRQHKRYVLVAHSMGGAIASLYLERYADDFERAVLSSPMHEPNFGMIPNEMACHALDLKAWIGRAENYAPGKHPYDDAANFDPNNGYTHSEVRYNITRATYDAVPETKIGGPSVRWVLEACDASKRAREGGGNVVVPVLLLQAGADSIVTATGQEEFCTILNRERLGGCRLEKIEGAYHELFVESDRYRIPAVTKLIEFIKGPAENSLNPSRRN